MGGGKKFKENASAAFSRLFPASFPRERTGDEVLRTSAWKANLTEILSVAVKV